YIYDNSEANARNPHHPPARIRYGSQSVDEMAELWLQFLPRRESDRPALARAYQTSVDQAFVEADEYTLRQEPMKVAAHIDLGLHLAELGRLAEATGHLQTALRLAPTNDEAHYQMGTVLRRQDKPEEARAEFETALRLNPQNGKAHGNLGFMCEEQGRLAEAEEHYRAALRLNPYDALAKASLEELQKRLGPQ